MDLEANAEDEDDDEGVAPPGAAFLAPNENETLGGPGVDILQP